MKYALKLLALIMSVFLIGVFLQDTMDSSKSNISESLGETFEIISELFSVFVALSIFGITWFAKSKSQDRHSLFLGATFCITGILILFHLLSYTFMPDFITPNSAHKSAIFFLESRFLMAVLILASVFVHEDSLPKLINKRVMVLFMITVLSVFLASGLFYEDFLAANDIDSFSTTTALLLLVITIIILVTCYLYAKIAKETGKIDLRFLIYGSIMVLLSNLVYFFYEFSGHFLIITGFSYFYFSLYKSSVEIPYEKLAIAEEKIRIGAENKYRNLFDNANDAIITTDHQDYITSFNRSAEGLFGWGGKQVIGKKLSEFFLLNHSAPGIETVHMNDTGTNIFVSLTISQLLDPNNKFNGLSFIIHDITERKKADLEYKTLLQAALDGFYVVDTRGSIMDVNESYCHMTGYSRDELLNMSIKDIDIIDTEEIIAQRISRIMEFGWDRFETRHRCKDGRIIDIEASVNYINIGIGKLFVFIRDITESKRAEKIIEDSLHEKETLLREIHHRVKNNMQIISSLLLLQSQNIIDQKYLDIFNDSNNRVLSMSLIHEKLYQSENLAQINIQEYINDLASNLMSSYGKGNSELEINVENIPLNINYAVPCGLILNELITNSLKYAFPKDRYGKIKIVFKKMDGNMIHFSVSDDGIGIPRDMDIRATKSLGMHLITALAENQLRGEIILNRERGTEFQINFKGE